MLCENESGVIGANRDAHGRELYYVVRGAGVRRAKWRARCGVRDDDPMSPSVTISARGEQRLRSGHPWIYRADVGDAHAGAGDLVTVRGARGRVLGQALYSDRSQIAIRMLSYGDEAADAALLQRRIEAAISFRQ